MFTIADGIAIGAKLLEIIINAIVDGASKPEVIRRVRSEVDRIERVDQDVDAAARGTHIERRET